MVAGLHCLCNIMLVETVGQDVLKFNIGGSLVCPITLACCRLNLPITVWLCAVSRRALRIGFVGKRYFSSVKDSS